jgi:hypothetical protein
MIKALLLCGAVLALDATVAGAQPLNLAWDDCGLNGSSNRTFACNTDAGVDVLVGSIVPPPGITALTGMVPTVLVAFAHNGIPPWWTFGAAPNCRPASSLIAAFPGGGLPGTCNTYFADRAAAGAHLPDANPNDPAQLRIRMVAAIDPGLAGPVAAGEELYLFTLTINHQRTTGETACAGCFMQAALIFWELDLTQPLGVGDFHFYSNFYGSSDLCAGWQGGGPFCGGDPATNATWGQIKSLYR